MNHALNQSTPNTAEFQTELQQATRVLREAIAATQAAIQGLEVLLEPGPEVSACAGTSLEPSPEPSPDARSPKRYYIHDGEKPRLCRGCGATIFWATTPRDKKMPVNPDGTSHWETCAERGLFKTEDF